MGVATREKRSLEKRAKMPVFNMDMAQMVNFQRNANSPSDAAPGDARGMSKVSLRTEDFGQILM